MFRVADPLNTPKSRNLVPCYLDFEPKSGGDQPELTELYFIGFFPFLFRIEEDIFLRFSFYLDDIVSDK